MHMLLRIGGHTVYCEGPMHRAVKPMPNGLYWLSGDVKPFQIVLIDLISLDRETRREAQSEVLFVHAVSQEADLNVNCRL